MREFVLELTNDNINKIFKRIPFILNYSRITRKKIVLKCHKIKKTNNEKLFWIKQVVTAYNIHNKKERYSYIYDVMVNYLDNEFICKNHCKFKDNKCMGVKYESEYGCCYGPTRGLCVKMKDHRCSIQSLSCKLAVCHELKRKKIRYRINNLPLLRIFFNPIQKYYLIFSIMKDKDETINLLLKYKLKIVYY